MARTMKALKCIGIEQTEVQDVTLPELKDDSIIVKINAVALNPTDWKHLVIAPMVTIGASMGCDYAGVVQQIGAKVTKPFKVGDRVCGMIYGGNRLQPTDGCFAEYARAKGDIAMKIPDHMSDEEAATLTVGVTTIGQAMYQGLGIPLPGAGSFDKPLLIYGGSTATGTLAIQYARLSGARVVTTCSPTNFELVKSLGAEQAFDYNDPDCAKKIRDFTKDELTKVFDCISEDGSAKLCEQAVSSNGGEIACLGFVKHERQDVETKVTFGATILGEPLLFPSGPIDPKPQDFEFGSSFLTLSSELISNGTIKAHPHELRQGGLEAIPQGIEQLRQGKVSGKKLVYRVSER